MAKVSKSDVEHLAKLANIAIPAENVGKLRQELESILEYVTKLQGADTKNVQPTSQVTGLVDVWREDKVKPSMLTRGELLKNVPQTKNGYIKVMRVL